MRASEVKGACGSKIENPAIIACHGRVSGDSWIKTKLGLVSDNWIPSVADQIGTDRSRDKFDIERGSGDYGSVALDDDDLIRATLEGGEIREVRNITDKFISEARESLTITSWSIGGGIPIKHSRPVDVSVWRAAQREGL